MVKYTIIETFFADAAAGRASDVKRYPVKPRRVAGAGQGVGGSTVGAEMHRQPVTIYIPDVINMNPAIVGRYL